MNVFDNRAYSNMSFIWLLLRLLSASTAATTGGNATQRRFLHVSLACQPCTCSSKRRGETGDSEDVHFNCCRLITIRDVGQSGERERERHWDNTPVHRTTLI